MSIHLEAKAIFENKAIKSVAYLTEEESRRIGWQLLRPLKIDFTDGTCVYLNDQRVVTGDGQTIPSFIHMNAVPSLEDDGILQPGEQPIKPFAE